MKNEGWMVKGERVEGGWGGINYERRNVTDEEWGMRDDGWGVTEEWWGLRVQKEGEHPGSNGTKKCAQMYIFGLFLV